MMNHEGRMQNGEADEPQVTAAATIDYANRQGEVRFPWLGKASCWCFVIALVAGGLCLAAVFEFQNERDAYSGIVWGLLTLINLFVFSLTGVAVAVAALVQRRQIGYALLGLFLNLVPLGFAVWSSNNVL